MHNKRKNYVVFTLRPVYTINYNINKKEQSLYSGYTVDKWVPTYMTRKSLVYWLSCRYDEIKNSMSKDMSEVERECHYNTNNNYKYYLVKIGRNYVKKIHPKDFEKDILLIQKKRVKKLDREYKKKLYNRLRGKDYSFRKGPVPCIRNYSSGNGWYRYPQLHRTRVNNAIVEYEDFVNPKYRAVNLPVWDDRPRHTDKSWKTSYKIKKQWMKHLDKHMDVE